MQKKGLFIATATATLIASAVRIFFTLYYTDPQTGKFTSPLWQILNAAALILCVLIPLTVYLKKYTDYKTEIPQNTVPLRCFSVLAALSSLMSSTYCVWKYLTSPYETFSIYIGAAGILSAVFFFYIAIRIHKTKKDLLLYLATGPFLFFILRIVETFNFYSRNISLYTYKYEIVGMCCALMLFISYIAASTGKTYAKACLFFSLCGFAFLIAYSLPQMLLPLMGRGYFTNNSSPYYLYSDFLFGICSVYFGTLCKPQKTVKH